MNPRLLPLLATLLASFLLSSCETTSNTDYGYYVGEFTDDSILQLFALSDEAENNQDFVTYESFFSPRYASVDETSGDHSFVYRTDYMDFVESIFKEASFMKVQTMVMDIEYTESGDKALVKVHEEEERIIHGNTEHYTSLIDVEVGFEDGWIFIDKTTRTSTQVIEE